MGPVASHAAQPYVFPGKNNPKINGMDDSVELLPTDDDGLYFIPFTHIRHKTPRALIYYSHGNAEDLYSIQNYLKELSKELKVDVISWDFAGYGKHKVLDDVQPSEENVYTDSLKMFAYVQIQADQQKIPIIVYGRSLGSAPAIYVASKHQNDCGALIVESGFRSISRIVSNTLHNIYDLFDNEALIKKQHLVPTLFIHGKKDHVVPFAHGERLYNICPCEKKYSFWLEDGHHNDIESLYRSEIYIRLNHFIDKII